MLEAFRDYLEPALRAQLPQIWSKLWFLVTLDTILFQRMEILSELFPQDDAFNQVPPATSTDVKITSLPETTAQSNQPKWKILTESEEYLQMLQERHDALRAGKVAPRPRTNRNQLSPFAGTKSFHA